MKDVQTPADGYQTCRPEPLKETLKLAREFVQPRLVPATFMIFSLTSSVSLESKVDHVCL